MIRINRNQVFAVAGMFFLFLSAGQVAALEKNPVNVDKNGVAIKGYDPVAYFTVGKPTKGSQDHAYEWNQAVWRFANEENRNLFMNDPEKYSPQYGGYCAYAMAFGDLVDINPKAWKIVDGKLYLNFSAEVQKKWEEDIPGYIKKADRNWPGVLRKDL